MLILCGRMESGSASLVYGRLGMRRSHSEREFEERALLAPPKRSTSSSAAPALVTLISRRIRFPCQFRHNSEELSRLADK
jgi:hypothetical protein